MIKVEDKRIKEEPIFNAGDIFECEDGLRMIICDIDMKYRSLIITSGKCIPGCMLNVHKFDSIEDLTNDYTIVKKINYKIVLE